MRLAVGDEPEDRIGDEANQEEDHGLGPDERQNDPGRQHHEVSDRETQILGRTGEAQKKGGSFCHCSIRFSGEAVDDGAGREDQHDPDDDRGEPTPVQPSHHAHEAGADDREGGDRDPDRTGQRGLDSFQHGLDRRQVLRESGRCESRQGCGDGQEAAEAMSEHAKFPCFTEDR